ncbi:MAG: transcriptional repressor [Halanaerobiales bacterium]|nr:transcriptional repressor [Halanaerobiales bacterium]
MDKTRMTKQRKTIINILKDTDTHPTAEWIYDQVKKEIPKISLGTVYRNLNLLAEKDQITVINYANEQSHYDGNTKNHYHFKCKNCKRIYDLDLDLFSKDLNKIANQNTNFKVSDHRLEFYGLCPICK